jgi:hypothetical protein
MFPVFQGGGAKVPYKKKLNILDRCKTNLEMEIDPF